MKTERKKPTPHFERVPLASVRVIERTGGSARRIRRPVTRVTPNQKGRDPYSIHPED